MDSAALVVALVPHLLWASVAVYAIKSLTAIKLSSKATSTSAAEEIPEIPDDLMALAMSHREPWAQEDTLRVISERYGDLKDWNRVRVAMNIGEIDG